jgi:peptidoglycan/xylan/chitin deacetylase (PgdA/CDA1 family)
VWSADGDVFDGHVRCLKSHFDVVTPPDLPDILRRGKGRYVLLTFDDGYLDNYRVAFPILKTHGVLATFFVATGFLDDPHLAWWDEIAWMVRTSRKHRIEANPWLSTQVVFDEPDREVAIRVLLSAYKLMPTNSNEAYLEFLAEATGSGRYTCPDVGGTWVTWALLREMRAAGMVVGGHTVNHPILARLSPERQWEEISGCGQRLAEELGEPMRYFAYPVGSRQTFDGHTRACLKRAGVQYGFSYYGGMRRFDDWDDCDVRRIPVDSGVDLDGLRAILALPRLYGRAR